MDYIRFLFVGALLCNCIPHVVAGLQGRAFPTPFAQPRGVGHSPASVNFLWGGANLFFGLFLLWRHSALLETAYGACAVAVGFLSIGVHLSKHFETVVEGRHKQLDSQSPSGS